MALQKGIWDPKPNLQTLRIRLQLTRWNLNPKDSNCLYMNNIPDTGFCVIVILVPQGKITTGTKLNMTSNYRSTKAQQGI